MKLSPMMEQYIAIKENYKDCILFFRLGDFYEMFFEDAKTASKELELTLTGKNCGQEERAPMCGVPFHSAETYVSKLVEKGYKVAICEQVEDPSQAKGIVKREVIRVVTPGTITSDTSLNENENNYLAAVYTSPEGVAVAYCDVSTGELKGTEFSNSDSQTKLLNELVKIKPKEIITNEYTKDFYNIKEIVDYTNAYISYEKDGYFSTTSCEKTILCQFPNTTLLGLGLDFRPILTVALGGLLSYLFETQKQHLNHIINLEIYDIGNSMALDKATIRNLEITETLYDKKTQGSLLGVLDKTQTAMGSRKLRQWLREPLNDLEEINSRLDGVEELFNNVLHRNNLRSFLREIYDFERLLGKISYKTANGRDLIALKASLGVLPEIKLLLSDFDSDLLKELDDNIIYLDEIYNLIDKAIVDEPPFLIKEGGLIRDGYSEALDNLKFSIKDGKAWISNLEHEERERTGIRTLKVGFNRVFGYYIEVSKSFSDAVPETYIRKQTLVNGERFITPELKEMESLVLNAESKINEMEYEIFSDIRNTIQSYIFEIQRTSKAISILDALCSYAHVSEQLGYTKPMVNESMDIEIIKGRHPVIEKMVNDGLFISNDTFLNNSDSSLLLITGPNMAGKSTYMRQTALIVLMAQAGCFVPCERAKIGVCDRIFTRIGASDNLAQGQSTFFVEMSELAYILNNAKDRSLIILDEIGRGTSTFDGLSIAWAVVEYLCNKNHQVRTLFATHYHELTILEEKLTGLKNLTVDVMENNGTIIFLHKIIEGIASKSYGIHVAQLAGIKNDILDFAQLKLNDLEKGSLNINLNLDNSENKNINMDESAYDKSVEEVPSNYINSQISMFESLNNPVLEKIKNLDLMELTPSQGIKLIEELKESMK